MFDAELSGASSLVIQSGRVGRLLKGSASVASTLNAANVEASKAIVDASGASKIIVRVSEEVIAKASGASSVSYLGSPEIVSKDASGASSIQPEN